MTHRKPRISLVVCIYPLLYPQPCLRFSGVCVARSETTSPRVLLSPVQIRPASPDSTITKQRVLATVTPASQSFHHLTSEHDE